MTRRYGQSELREPKATEPVRIASGDTGTILGEGVSLHGSGKGYRSLLESRQPATRELLPSQFEFEISFDRNRQREETFREFVVKKLGNDGIVVNPVPR